MLSTGVHLEANSLGAALTGVGNHAEDGMLNNLLRVVAAELGGGCYNLVANVAGVAGVNLSALFVAGEDGFVSVHNDDVVTAVNVGRKDSLVLSTQQVSGLNGELTDNHVGGVDHIPLALNILGFGREGFHNCYICSCLGFRRSTLLGRGEGFYSYFLHLSTAFCVLGAFFSEFFGNLIKSACKVGVCPLNYVRGACV